MSSEKIPTENGMSYEDLHRELDLPAKYPSLVFIWKLWALTTAYFFTFYFTLLFTSFFSLFSTYFFSLSAPFLDSSTETQLRVLTLNVWCLPQPWPIGSKDRKFRLKKLAEAILRENYDIVGLQEVWVETDYLDMVDRLANQFRFHHYFHSGFTGSGVCVFSRHPIVSTLTLRYSLNGFAHHVHRGDWFGGKVVGLVEIEVGEMKVNFYCTHLHAEYDREHDMYLSHRTAQSYELSQFVRHTSCGADVVIVTGDLNMEPEDLGLRLILSQARLLDCWRLAHPVTPQDNVSLSKNRGVDRGGTCDRPDNCYSSKRFRENDESKRIDYILFKSGRMSVSLEECEVTMNKIPDENINFSDHVGLQAQFRVESEQRQVCLAYSFVSRSFFLCLDNKSPLSYRLKFSLSYCPLFTVAAVIRYVHNLEFKVRLHLQT
ncbi:unnamed protein product [Cylicostephanus goldi]|uniref:sphingomyelin phosphodiesterase n=1 Tax=Cylicostephanus goldi TaxID=71465 RepID=A0A3P7LR88_CYLGO|nr:unnamed protein product [Cylicostephanus goldi]